MNYQEMKDELWRAFSRNLPIKVNVIENGRMVLKEISPDSNNYSDMYTKQSTYLNDKIHSSSVDSIMKNIHSNESFNDEVDELMSEVHASVKAIDTSDKNEKVSDDYLSENSSMNKSSSDEIKQLSEEKSINDKIVVIKNDYNVYVIGNITEKELREKNNPVYEIARKMGNNIIICNTKNCNVGVNYSTKSGILFTVLASGNISITGNYDKIEYVNYSKTLSYDDLDIIFKNASMGHKMVLSSLLTKYGIANMWNEILARLDSKDLNLEVFKKFVVDIKSIYSISEIIYYDIFNSNYKKIISKYPIEDELFVNLSSVLGYARNGFKKGLTVIITKYGVDNIWMDIADALRNGVITKKDYEDFKNNLKKMYSKEECEKYEIFSNKYFKALQDGNLLNADGFEKLDILQKDNMDHKVAPSKAKKSVIDKKQKVKKRRIASDSLKDKFLTKVSTAKEWWGGLSPKTKGIIIASTIAVVGVGILALNVTTIKDISENVNSTLNFSSFNSAMPSIDHITQQIHNSVGGIQDTINNIQNTSINWDVIGEGHVGYRSAADAINGMNGVTLNGFFGKEPSSNIFDIYNTTTGWMHLTKEQLNDPELLRTLSQDPNNAIHIKDAWFNLSDVASEVIKGGKML